MKTTSLGDLVLPSVEPYVKHAKPFVKAIFRVTVFAGEH